MATNYFMLSSTAEDLRHLDNVTLGGHVESAWKIFFERAGYVVIQAERDSKADNQGIDLTIKVPGKGDFRIQVKTSPSGAESHLADTVHRGKVPVIWGLPPTDKPSDLVVRELVTYTCYIGRKARATVSDESYNSESKALAERILLGKLLLRRDNSGNRVFFWSPDSRPRHSKSK